MAVKSPATATDEQKAGLKALAASRERGETDWARAILLNAGQLDQRRDRRSLRRA